MTTTTKAITQTQLHDFQAQTLFDYRNAVLKPAKKAVKPVDIEKVTVLHLELYSLGYHLTPDAFRALSSLSATAFAKEANRLTSTIQKRIGNNVKYHVLYKGFPDEVPNFDIYQMFRVFSMFESFFGINQEGKKLQCGHLVESNLFDSLDFGACPVCQMQDATLLKDGGADFKESQKRLDYLKANNVKLQDIGVATVEDFNGIVRNIFAASSSITPQDEKVIEYVVDNFTRPDIISLVPTEFGFKEVMAQVVARFANRFGKHDTARYFSGNVKTAQDVLRVAKMMRDIPIKAEVEKEGKTLMDGFVHSATTFGNKMDRVKYKLNNTQRKTIVALLDKVQNPVEDMIHDRMDWVHLNKSVHFGQFKDKYPNAFAATDQVFNRPETIKTFESVYESLLAAGDVKALTKHLSTRGGMFGRVLDKVLREHEGQYKTVLNAFEKSVGDVSMRVLLSLHNVFRSRSEGFNERVYVDADTGKTKVMDDLRKDLKASVNTEALNTVNRMIGRKLKSEQSVSKVVIDPVLQNFKVPVKMRNTTQAVVKSERGSAQVLDAEKYLTLFTYWKESADTGRVDLDLSVTLYRGNYTQTEMCSYYDHNRESSRRATTHSGDIQSAPNGATEMVRIDLEKARNNGARYAVVLVNSFTNSPFDSFDAFTGVMAEHSDTKTSSFNPLAVKDRFDLIGSGENTVSVVYDIETGKLITTNMVTDGFVAGNFDSYRDATESILRYIVNEEKTAMTLYDYFLAFALENNAEVHDKAVEGEEYDYVFDFDTSQNIDEFNAKWL